MVGHIKFQNALNTSNYLGNAAVNRDQMPSFLRAMAEWVNRENFQLRKVNVDSAN